MTLVAESPEHGIVGFINGHKGRDEDFKDYCEVCCLYLLKKYQGKKIGYNLLKEFFRKQVTKGFSKGYLWVLESNPSIKFYERAGGLRHGREKEDEIGGQVVKETMYLWNNLVL